MIIKAKSPWRSKTVWLGVLTSVVGPILPFVVAPQVATAVLTGAAGTLGILVRLGILDAEQAAIDAQASAAESAVLARQAATR